MNWLMRAAMLLQAWAWTRASKGMGMMTAGT